MTKSGTSAHGKITTFKTKQSEQFAEKNLTLSIVSSLYSHCESFVLFSHNIETRKNPLIQ